MISGRAFLVLDRLLDQPTGGPLFLRRPEIAGVVVQALLDGQLRLQRYQLHAFVVMPNHVPTQTAFISHGNVETPETS
jgi:hypothetical protein